MIERDDARSMLRGGISAFKKASHGSEIIANDEIVQDSPEVE